MNGIDKIIQRIQQDNETECQVYIDRANAQAQQIIAGSTQAASLEYDSSIAEGKRAADERLSRLGGSAESEAKKMILTSKQKMLDRAYDLAMEKLKEYEALPEFFARLACLASVTGDESIIMNPSDRAAIGEKTTALANEALKNAGKKANITLSESTRDISGGFYLSGGSIETNCTFESLLKTQREQGAAETAKVLFE